MGKKVTELQNKEPQNAENKGGNQSAVCPVSGVKIPDEGPHKSANSSDIKVIAPKAKVMRFAWFLPAAIYQFRTNMLSVFGEKSFKISMGRIPLLTRSAYVVNAGNTVRALLRNPGNAFPKSTMFTYILSPLVRNASFVASGDEWVKRRKMIEASYQHLRTRTAFRAIRDGCEAMIDRLQQKEGAVISLDEEMTYVTADIIHRQIFSEPLESQEAKITYEAFADFIESVPHWDLAEFFRLPAWVPRRSRKKSLLAGKKIRDQIHKMVAKRKADPDMDRYDDMLSLLLQARDDHGQPFDDEELVDEVAVLYLAGHETSASLLTWAVYLMSQKQSFIDRLRDEARPYFKEGLKFEHVSKLKFSKDIFREALRLYPPIAFIPRDVKKGRQIRRWNVKNGAIMLIAPWLMHRHTEYWRDPDIFDPDRFRDQTCRHAIANYYIPFGLGERSCPGASFATMEGVMLLSYLLSGFDVEVLEGQAITPRVRVTLRPAEALKVRLHVCQ